MRYIIYEGLDTGTILYGETGHFTSNSGIKYVPHDEWYEVPKHLDNTDNGGFEAIDNTNDGLIYKNKLTNHIIEQKEVDDKIYRRHLLYTRAGVGITKDKY